MRRHLRKTFLIIISLCFLALTPYVSAKNDVIAFKNADEIQVIKDVRVNDLDIEPMNTYGVKKNVVPDTISEGKKVMAYFLEVMSLVVLCTIILCLVLIFKKKFYGSDFSNLDEEKYFEAYDLSAPKSKQDALKMFLNRTK